MSTLDPETSKELTEAESVILMTESSGWKVVKGKLDAKIIDLQLIGNVEGNTPQDKVTNMEARAMAVDILYSWTKDDIYGFIEQQQVNSDALRDSGNESHIDRTT